MIRTQLRKELQEQTAAPVTEERVRRQIGQAAGTEYFQHRDPLYHVTENFQMTFDAIGQRHAQELEGSWTDQPQREGQDGPAEGFYYRQMPDKTSTQSFYERGDQNKQQMLRKFSETAFQRGNMSAAVLQGTGQMMLFSCLKKTVGQNQPNKWQQRKLFEKFSPHRNSPGQTPNKIIFNRGFTDSAIGLVVDTLRDARRTVEDMQELATGRKKNEAGLEGSAQTLQKMYPFLDDSRERQLLEEYTAQLEEMDEADPRRSILHNALGRTRALITKKAQMKLEFINKLRFISDRASEALEVFQAPGFSDQIYQQLQQETDLEPPPDEGDDNDGAPTDPTGSAEN